MPFEASVRLARAGVLAAAGRVFAVAKDLEHVVAAAPAPPCRRRLPVGATPLCACRISFDPLHAVFDALHSDLCARGIHLQSTQLLPDHLHAIWTLPPGDMDHALRWRMIRSTSSRSLPGGQTISASRADKGERGIWQRR
jgi:hypothetical protein